MELILQCFATAFTLTYFAIPSIIKIALDKNLMDNPGERSSHDVSTPSLGGIAIFAGVIFAIVMWAPTVVFSKVQYLLGAFIIIFLIGAKDDIAPVSPSKKLLAQVGAATIIVLNSGVELHSFYGLLGIHNSLHPLVYLFVSIFTILVLINAFNLIDGINGLAAGIGALICTVLGCWFYFTGQIEFTVVAFATVGGILAFLRYNISPAQIFMGDTGSLLIGMICAILIVKFIDSNYNLSVDNPYRFQGGPAVAIGIMIIPVFDTLRVFITRIMRGISPFKPDRRHIHHLLVDVGFNHMEATAILVFVNSCFILFVFSFHALLNMHWIILIMGLVAGVLTYYLNKRLRALNEAKLQFKESL
ncbi:MAG: MraY family glycosyltransferase [Haliscomenobacter sp.]|uniref:glycosyltransferase family 4 protein n=1 Tax=Haliscomenobacter sp. TaxID=2717303 RepID=UPI0029B1F204|nr:MraY family glycosyltransferase [Haliscomenobacter sp.]MDX2068239.1 MraY family glycosyltransferase [Haliscomenobacter sp.]